jgi:hypothetical protein
VAALPEAAALPWRRRRDVVRLERAGRLWTAYAVAGTVQFIATAAVLLWIEPLLAPMSAIALFYAWALPELYAQRGANVAKPKGRRNGEAEPVAQGLLGDLLSHDARELQRETGLALERGSFGMWLLGEAGAILVRPGGRRVHCFCVRTDDAGLPPSDRIAHLLLALRSDEEGFATVANHAFSGAPWRLRRRLPARMRPALDQARKATKSGAR